MLLRSSSNPLLESLLPLPIQGCCHTDPAAGISKRENVHPGEAIVPKSRSSTAFGRGTTSSSSALTASLTHSDPQLQSPSPAVNDCRTSIRKVSSENDLFILENGSSSSATAAQVTAKSLLHDDNSDSCLDLDPAVSSRSPYSPSRTAVMPLGLSRWRSLGSLPSELRSVLYDSDFAISEEGDLASPKSSCSAAVDDVEERERQIFTFDKLALPVGDSLNVTVDSANEFMDHVRPKLDNVMDNSCTAAKPHACVRDGLDLTMVVSPKESPSFLPESGTSTVVSQSKYVCEIALGAGAGGRGTRPPTSTIGKGGPGGGDAGGCGGRSSDATELHYQSMLKESPGHPLILQNYAQYLAKVKHDYHRAEEFFERAILANPCDGELLGQYAKLLWEVRQDRQRAATYFERAVQAAPDNSYVMAAYASFLWSADEEEEESVEEVQGSHPANVPANIFSLVSTGLS